jgi:CDP-diglyceride synthetase
MFKQRLLMTVILIPLVLLAIYQLPGIYFAGLATLLLAAMLWEWQQFVHFPEVEKPLAKFSLLLIGALLVAKFWTLFIFVDLLFWLFATFVIVTYPNYQKLWSNDAFVALNAWLLLGVIYALIIELQMQADGKNQLVALMAIVWAADIGAYLVGKQWGEHKMIPLVSPGKSWEGLFGGLGLACIVGAIESVWLNPFSNFKWFILVVVVALISVIGDLWMSLLKRRCQLKDTGHLIPGHGGLLDRLDSLLAALPVFYLASKMCC